MVQAYVTAWMCALAIKSEGKSQALAGLALVGVAAALTHLYAGLFCASAGGGMLCVAIIYGRRDLLRPALALIVPAGIVTAGWIIYAHSRVYLIGWIDPLSMKGVTSALG